MTYNQNDYSTENYWENWEKAEKEKQRMRFQQQEEKRLGGKYNYLKFTKDNYDNKKVLDSLKGFPKESYLLFGKVGTGKTHAAVSIARDIREACFITLGDLALKIRACNNASEEISIYEYYSKRPLILDDIGAEKGTEFVLNILYRILDNRIKNMQQGLIITSNKDLKSLEETFGSRIISRILGIVGQNIIEITGKDRRIGGVL